MFLRARRRGDAAPPAASIDDLQVPGIALEVDRGHGYAALAAAFGFGVPGPSRRAASLWSPQVNPSFPTERRGRAGSSAHASLRSCRSQRTGRGSPRLGPRTGGRDLHEDDRLLSLVRRAWIAASDHDEHAVPSAAVSPAAPGRVTCDDRLVPDPGRSPLYCGLPSGFTQTQVRL